jgi:hypothetical protein
MLLSANKCIRCNLLTNDPELWHATVHELNNNLFSKTINITSVPFCYEQRVHNKKDKILLYRQSYKINSHSYKFSVRKVYRALEVNILSSEYWNEL